MDDGDEYEADLFPTRTRSRCSAVFGYMCILRLNISYSRYWRSGEGDVLEVDRRVPADPRLRLLRARRRDAAGGLFSVAIVQLFEQ